MLVDIIAKRRCRPRNRTPKDLGEMAGDPQGYYRLLGTQPSASATEIKAAYRRMAKEWHPDTNPRPEAKSRFQSINQAYDVLSKPVKRAQYDAGAATPEVTFTAPAPVRCCRCQEITAQPRYIVFWWVISALIVSQRRYFQGVFCSKCADIEALKAAMKTWLLGWWNITGAFYSVWSIYQNLRGGQRPAEINSRILAQQAVYFATQRHRPDLAIALLDQALLFNPVGELSDILAFRQEMIRLVVPQQIPRIKENWGLLRKVFFLQAAPIVLVAGVITLLVIGNSHSNVLAGDPVKWRDMGAFTSTTTHETEHLYADTVYDLHNQYRVLKIKILDEAQRARLTAKLAFDCNGHAVIVQRLSYDEKGNLTDQEAHPLSATLDPAAIHDASSNGFFSSMQRYVCPR
jgi:hypothetical protein